MSQEDTCADYYGRYTNYGWAVVEGKSSEIKDGIKQVRMTVMALRKINKKVDSAIIVAKTFGNEPTISRRRGHDLWYRMGLDWHEVWADTEKKDIIIEGWQPGEWGGRLD